METTEAHEETQPEWTPEQFNYAASDEDLNNIKNRVVARFNNETLVSGMKDTILKSGHVAEGDEAALESAVMLTIYIHTAYEIGKEAALLDMDGFIDNFLNSKKAQQEIQLAAEARGKKDGK